MGGIICSKGLRSDYKCITINWHRPQLTGQNNSSSALRLLHISYVLSWGFGMATVLFSYRCGKGCFSCVYHVNIK